MKVDFGLPILDINDKPLREPRLVDGQVKPRVIPTKWRSYDAAAAAGEPTLNLHPSEDGTTLVRHDFDMQDVTLMAVAKAALVQVWPGEELSTNDAMDRWELTILLRRAERDGALVVDLTTDQRAAIQKATDHYVKSNRVFFARARELLARDAGTAGAIAKRRQRSN